MSPLVKRIFEKHVDRILSPATKPEAELAKEALFQQTACHSFKAAVLEFAAEHGRKVRITGPAKIWVSPQSFDNEI